MIWLGCAAFVVLAMERVWAMVDRFRPKPPLHEVYATKADLAALVTRLDQIDSERKAYGDRFYLTMREEMEKLRVLFQVGNEKVQERLTEVMEDVAELKGRMREKDQHRQ